MMPGTGGTATDAKPGLVARIAVVFVSIVLVGGGVAVALYAKSTRTTLPVTSTTCVVTSSDIGDAPGRREDEPAVTRLSSSQAGACSATALPNGMRLAQLTVKRASASDTLLAALLATSLALVVCGAFFTRIESVAVGGVGIGVRRDKRKDTEDTSRAVDRVAEEMQQAVPSEAVERAKLAAKEKAADLREVAIGKRAIPPIMVPTDRLAELRRGNPLPADVLDELARKALDEQLEASEGPEPG